MRNFVILLGLIFLFGCKNSEKQGNSSQNDPQITRNDSVSEDQFLKTYYNEKWKFSLKYPEDYQILESEVGDGPVINFYPDSNSYNPPFGIHEEADNAYIAILPEGMAVDGPSGERKTFNETNKDYFPDLSLNKEESTAYFLESGEPWAFFLNFENTPENWSDYAGLFVHFKLNDFESICLDKNGNKVSMEDCAPPGDEHMVLKGNIEKASRDELMQIASSFSFKSSDTTKVTDKIKIEKPLPNMDVTSPLTIKGQARGTWFFEGSAPIQLVDKEGNELARTNIKVEGNWMTEDFVDFSGTLKFDAPDDERGYLIFWRANPSGKPETKESYRQPVIFPPK